jgi:hypothetical protein
MMTDGIAWAAAVLAEGLIDSWIVKGLAIAGGAVVGGLLVGFIARAATRTLTTRPMPLWGVRLLRFAGGVASGWLVWLFLSSTGSGKPGGEGGLLPGGPSRSSDKSAQESDKDKKKKKPDEATPGKVVRVEVLGEKALEVLKQPAEDRFYRIEGDPKKTNVYDLKGIQEVLRRQHDKEPALRVVIVRYKDSPVERSLIVSDLEGWLKDQGMFKKSEKVNEHSPEVRSSMP